MDVSIGVMAYNEANNIVALLNTLLSQKTNIVNIKEIIVVSSGCTDNTCKLVKKFYLKNKKVKLVEEKERLGKSRAINLFLSKVKSDILVLESADTIPEIDAIETLCVPFCDKNIGITGSRPVPLKSRHFFFNFLSSLLWNAHHDISLIKPKYGELIAFRRLFDMIPLSSVDEEEIASLIIKQGLKGLYIPKAVVYNKGPQSIPDFICQRRRIFAGHLSLKRSSSYAASTMSLWRILKVVFFRADYFFKNPFYFLFAGLLELYSRFLGLLDFWFGKNHVVWK
ncbi:MAG: glycosyltransferase, partial [Nanoarchaeota archaeon]|nr:glycosyltransferase [Nanoarchaeota archaeon]